MLDNHSVLVAPWIRTFQRIAHRNNLRVLIPTLAIWGGAAGAFALSILEVAPLIQRDVLQHIPVAGSLYKARLEKAALVD
ncbi:uncharacterized protein BJ171DRAFT_518554 [Polychytrium aggregatum]|uniref:uncharacterized protein n=1 Tax=Polychytrium aggregatum TaxID=110093 RepID=UPI0022FEA6F0|nr:uncharacterized protein BJ171DRAFT_518554 [Polychytrium aggregatum]KAI9199493.1 hypothetical protein BJ171DRAFT_518554 [Polychytrium aggregatum]